MGFILRSRGRHWRVAQTVHSGLLHFIANMVPPNRSRELIMVQNFFQLGQTTATSGESEFPNVPLLETSPSMRAVVTVIRELGHNSVPVLLIGEHGTGKQ